MAMARNDHPALNASSSRWLGVMLIGVFAAIPGWFAFGMVLSHPGLASTRDWIVNSTWFFGGLVLAVGGFLGYARSRRRQQVGCERARDRAPRR